MPTEFEHTLWKAADKLRGSMDASQYKDVVLGLVFLKYVSDAFDERRAELPADRVDVAAEYRFWVPEPARWAHLTANPGAVHEAVELVTAANPALAATLPRTFREVDERRLGELLQLLGAARFTGSRARDLLGEVYEYFLERFARAEGRRGGEFYTPAGVVRLLVAMLEPRAGRVYDPCCGSGGMFVQARHHGGAGLTVYGQELNERTWRLAGMNLAIHGIDGDLGQRWGDTFAADLHPDLRADVVLANPPFNIRDWARDERDPRWRFGVPPAGNANFAWIQHIVAKLAPGGSAGVVMANGSMSSNSGGEGEIRARLVAADLVACMVALPTQLFRSTGIPVCLWLLTEAKARPREVLFVDARELGHLVDRTERALSDDDIARVAGVYRAWLTDRGYADQPGFCRAATLAEIAAQDHALTPGRYVGATGVCDEPDDAEEEVRRLTDELFARFDESRRLAEVVRERLGRVRSRR